MLCCVRLFATPWTVACKAPPSMGFSRQEYWSGLPLPSPEIQLLLLLSCFSRVRLCATHRQQPTRLPRPWDSPGKNTGVGCHFLLQRMKVKSESEVIQSCPTLSDPKDCSLPGFSVHGIFQTRVLEWGVIAFSNFPSPKPLPLVTTNLISFLEVWLTYNTILVPVT